ncbi:MAG: transcriptional initiation protein Tat, partial [Myxococcales bacterium]|nr:transcriptional initiation protein Tat [Myxococcales bacterium]
HGRNDVPFVLAGSCGGQFKQGQFMDVGGKNHKLLLNTIAAAVGVKKDNGDPIDNFGDPALPNGHLNEIKV